jgi:DnaK suppressor protein
MSKTLTLVQRAQLREWLVSRQRELEARSTALLGGAGRAAHARDVLLQDGDDATQHDADREVDLARTDREMVELAACRHALARLDGAGYGLCADCAEPIAFERLKAEPWALCCVRCERIREGLVVTPRL